MDPGEDTQLTSRRLPLLIIGGGIALAAALVAVVVFIILRPPVDRPPTDADRRALANEVCPRVAVSHLYEVTKDGKTSYLFGTRHASVALARFPPVVADSFHKSKTLVVEFFDDSPPPATPPPRPEKSVEELLGPKLWARYRSLVGDEVAARVNHGSPAQATAVLSLLYEDTSQTVDVELQTLAKQATKPIIGLDEPAEPDATDTLEEEYLGIDVLRRSLQLIHRRGIVERQTRKTLRAYCSGERFLVTAYEDVTNERTRAWVPKLLPLLAEGGVFVAVGIAHVDAGTVGLVELLREEGFAVQPVN